jgi:transposase
MSNVLSDEKRQQVIALGRIGWTLRRIEQATGVRRETASAYLKTAGIGVRSPGWRGRRSAKPAIEVTTDFCWGKPPFEGDHDDSNRAIERTIDPESSKPAIGVTTDSCWEESQSEAVPEVDEPKQAKEVTGEGDSTTPVRVYEPAFRSATTSNRTPSACEPYREIIETGLERGRNAMAIWQDLVTSYGFEKSYQSVKRYVQKIRPSRVLQPRAVIVTGNYRRTRLFVMTLGYSRKSVRLLVFKSSSRVWAELHETAFRRLGGSVRIIVLDNLREGVLTPDIFDPTLNPLFRDLLAHYGAVAMPCRIKDPDRKGKVESGVGHAQKTPLKGLRFESLEQAQTYLDEWEGRWADTRIHGTTKLQVSAMFAEEKPALIPLPVEPFRFYQYGQRAVHLDGCVEVEAAYYSAPPGWIGRRVSVQWDGHVVRLLDPKTGQLLREHLRQKRGWHRIKEADRSPRTPLGTTQLLRRAARAGPHIGALCEAIHNRQGQAGVRRIQGVLSLAKRFGSAVVDDACSAAMDLGSYDYRFVRRYLERRPPLPLLLHQVDPLIRELEQYRDLILQRTKEQENNEHH